MPELGLSRKLRFDGAAALGLAAGASGIAGANSSDHPPAAGADAEADGEEAVVDAGDRELLGQHALAGLPSRSCR